MFKKKCTHNKVNILSDAAYCPDCGEFIKNKWYICRCQSCNIKRKATILFDKVIPEEHYCPNCGSSKFILENLENLDCINIHFAVLKRESLNNSFKFNFAPLQIWVAACNESTQHFLPCTG